MFSRNEDSDRGIYHITTQQYNPEDHDLNPATCQTSHTIKYIINNCRICTITQCLANL